MKLGDYMAECRLMPVTHTHTPGFGFYNMDCMEGMKQFPDNYFDLAIVDPPYMVQSLYVKGKSSLNATSRLKKYGNLADANDQKPTKEYFDELFRVSKNQIVWGFNHLCDMLPPTTEFIFWYKHNPVKSYSDGELAWTSFKKTAKCFDYPYFGSNGADEERIHPTQKPIALYKWILNEYANRGDIILDTHVGSASSLIACHECGFNYVGYEINTEFYEKACERLEKWESQMNIFGYNPYQD